MTYRDFYHFSRFLKQSLLSHKINIRRVSLPSKIDGDCNFDGKKFIIRIEKNIPAYYAIEVLIHEAAHCISWTTDQDELHNDSWGKAYSKTYRIFLDWYHKKYN